MRIEATLPEPTNRQLSEVSRELGVSKSQVIEEALSLFLRAVLEAKRGRRIAVIETDTQRPICEVVSPSITQVEWTLHRERIVVGRQEAQKLRVLVDDPPAPNPVLQRLMGKKRR